MCKNIAICYLKRPTAIYLPVVRVFKIHRAAALSLQTIEMCYPAYAKDPAHRLCSPTLSSSQIYFILFAIINQATNNTKFVVEILFSRLSGNLRTFLPRALCRNPRKSDELRRMFWYNPVLYSDVHHDGKDEYKQIIHISPPASELYDSQAPTSGKYIHAGRQIWNSRQSNRLPD